MTTINWKGYAIAIAVGAGLMFWWTSSQGAAPAPAPAPQPTIANAAKLDHQQYAKDMAQVFRDSARRCLGGQTKSAADWTAWKDKSLATSRAHSFVHVGADDFNAVKAGWDAKKAAAIDNAHAAQLEQK